MLSLCRWNHFKVIAALRHIGIDSLFDRVPQTYRGRLLTTSPGGGQAVLTLGGVAVYGGCLRLADRTREA
jgi:hypothetical protein